MGPLDSPNHEAGRSRWLTHIRNLARNMPVKHRAMQEVNVENVVENDGDIMLAWEDNEKTMKAKIFNWQDVVLITQDKDNKRWVVITF